MWTKRGPGLVLPRRKRRHSSAELLRCSTRRFKMTERPLVAVCLARQSALCNGIRTFTVYSWRNLLRGYVTQGVDSTRQEAECVAAQAGASKFPRILAPAWPPLLTATRDDRHGRLPASRPGRLLPLPPGRQTLPSHLPTRRMAGPVTCPANTCRPGPLPPFWRDRSQHSGCPTQAARGRYRPSPTTWPACRLTWKAYG